MTTFQAIVYGVIHGFTQFFPLSPSVHHRFISYLLEWPEPTARFLGVLSFGSFLALLIFFFHDWASMISSVLRVFIYRKRPMTLDERMPFFLLLAATPLGVLWFFASNWLNEQQIPLTWLLLLFAGLSVPLWLSDRYSRKNKNYYDWNWLDSLFAGIFQAFALIPGSGSIEMLLTAGFFRNFSREGVIKFAFLALTPFLAARSIYDLRELQSEGVANIPDFSWLTFSVTIVVTCVSSLLAIGGMTRSFHKKGVNPLVCYRLLLALGVGIVFWYRNHSG